MSIKLVILGILMEGEKHPYEIQQIMKERMMDKYIKIPGGSLYYAVDLLLKGGFIEVVDVVRDSNRPDKTIYRITGAGREEFADLLMKQFSTGEHYYHPMYPALAFAKYGDQKKIADILQRKIEQIEIRLPVLRDTYQKNTPVVSRAGLHIMMGFMEHVETELRWLKRIRKDALEGRLKEVGTPIAVEEDE